MNLILKGIGSLPWADNSLQDARKVVHYLREMSAPNSMLRVACPKLRVKGYCATRFGTQHILISRVLKLQHVVEGVVISPVWQCYVQKFKSLDERQRTHKLKATIASPTFWAGLENFRQHMKS